MKKQLTEVTYFVPRSKEWSACDLFTMDNPYQSTSESIKTFFDYATTQTIEGVREVKSEFFAMVGVRNYSYEFDAVTVLAVDGVPVLTDELAQELREKFELC